MIKITVLYLTHKRKLVKRKKILKENPRKQQLRDFFQFYYQTLVEVHPQQNLVQVLWKDIVDDSAFVWSELGNIYGKNAVDEVGNSGLKIHLNF